MTRVPHRAALLALVSGAIRGRRKVRASPPPKLVDGRQWRSRPRLRVLALVYLVVEEISSQGRGRQREKEIGLFPRQPCRSFVLTEEISWFASGARFKLRFEEGRER